MFQNSVREFLQPFKISIFKHSIRKFVPRRALLYVPADSLKKVLKAFLVDVDCIMLDCEDGVVLNKKPQARINIRELLDKGKPKKKRHYDLGVRVNSVGSTILHEDLSVILTGKHLPDTILLSKVESRYDIGVFVEHITSYVKKDKKVKLSFLMGIESPVSLVNLVDICKAAREFSENFNCSARALIFGIDDFCASLGVKRSDSSELMYARQKIATVAKAFELQAIDISYPNYEDLEGLKKESEEGVRLGYTGKQIIHPVQVDVVQAAFVPSKAYVKWAKEILIAFHKHQIEGEGVFSYKGRMINMPTMRQAQNIMDLANSLKIYQE